MRIRCKLVLISFLRHMWWYWRNTLPFLRYLKADSLPCSRHWFTVLSSQPCSLILRCRSRRVSDDSSPLIR